MRQGSLVVGCLRSQHGQEKAQAAAVFTSSKLLRQVFKILEGTVMVLKIPQDKAGMCLMVQQSVMCVLCKSKDLSSPFQDPRIESGACNLCIVGKGGYRQVDPWSLRPRKPRQMDEFQFSERPCVAVDVHHQLMYSNPWPLVSGTD